ncbi:hypothetical protein SBA4_70004 [Candidatus Sulfopaludibacter sp. SbA4]|nr:hypothetical protein SBA4_70004 [Candidatus Sulfopaludibacter sp. SbA4]
MDVNPQARVVRQVVAIVVGILIDHNLVPAPIPVGAIAHIRIGHREVEAAEPETRRTSARQPPSVTRSETRREAAVLPRMIHMIPGVVLAGIVPNPLVPVHVGSLGVSLPVGKMLLRRWGALSRPPRGSRPPGGRRPRRGSVTRRRGAVAGGFAGFEVGVGLSALPSFLGEANGANRQNQNRKRCDVSFHVI